MTAIIDISAPINFAAFAADGGIAVIAKCTEGMTIATPSFASSKAAAISAGLVVGSYHFLHAGNADKQAAWYLKNLNPAQGERVVCDAEVYLSSSPSLTDIKLFVQTILAARPDLHITIYGGLSYLQNTVGVAADPYLSQMTDLWIAEWTNSSVPKLPGTWATWALWQYTGTQRGFGGSVDLDRFNGSDDALRAWIGPAGGAAPVVNLSSVAGLQRAFNGLGYPVTVDGNYGQQTGAALSKATDNGANLLANAP